MAPSLVSSPSRASATTTTAVPSIAALSAAAYRHDDAAVDAALAQLGSCKASHVSRWRRWFRRNPRPAAPRGVQDSVSSKVPLQKDRPPSSPAHQAAPTQGYYSGPGGSALVAGKPRLESDALRLLAKLVWKRVSSRRGSFVMGYMSIVVIVTVAAVLGSFISNGPLIFLGLAELSTGQRDIILTPLDTLYRQTLNFTAMVEVAGEQGVDTGLGEQGSFMSPRVLFEPDVLVLGPASTWEGSSCSPSACSTAASVSEFATAWDCLVDACSDTNVFSALGVALDTLREKAIGLGRAWDYAPLGGFEFSTEPSRTDDTLFPSVAISVEQARRWGAAEGDTILLYIPLDWVLSELVMDMLVDVVGFSVFEATNIDGNPLMESIVPCRVKFVYDGNSGKFASGKNPLLFELEDFTAAVGAYGSPFSSAAMRAYVGERVTAEEYATEVTLNYPHPRTDVYKEKSFPEVLRAAGAHASRVLLELGFPRLVVDTTLLEAVDALSYVNLFLQLILVIILVSMSGLSVLLVYSFTASNLELSAYDVAVLRMMGLPPRGVVSSALFEAFLYGILGTVVGLLVSSSIYKKLIAVLSDLSGLAIDDNLEAGAIGLAIFIGFGVPLLASYGPTRQALSLRLQDALNPVRRVASLFEYEIQSNDTLQDSLRWKVIIIGTSLGVLAFVMYYVLPLALLTVNLALLLSVFFVLLLGMTFAMVVLSMNFLYLAERIAARIVSLPFNLSIQRILVKNLDAHRRRNQRSALMFTGAVALVMFSSATYRLQLQVATIDVYKAAGSDISVESAASYVIHPSWIEPLLMDSDVVSSWSYVTLPLGNPPPFNPLFCKILVVGVSPGFGATTRDDLYSLVEARSWPSVLADSDRSGHYIAQGAGFESGDMSEEDVVLLSLGLYSAVGSVGFWTGGRYRTYTGLDAREPSNDAVIRRSARPSYISALQGEQTSLADLRESLPPLRMSHHALFSSAPVFYFSEYDSYSGQDIVVSLPAFLDMARELSVSPFSSEFRENGVFELGPFGLSHSVGYRHCTIRLKDDAPQSAIDSLIVSIEAGGSFLVDVTDSEALGRDLAPIVRTLDAVFGGVLIVALLLGFFSLVTSVYGSVIAHQHEIGILRALGARKRFIMTLYWLEAMVVVLASVLLGFLIGLGVSWTFVLQQQLFTGQAVPLTVEPSIVVVLLCSIAFLPLLTVAAVWRAASSNIVAALKGR